jgi:aminoglycoside phosphotransferase
VRQEYNTETKGTFVSTISIIHVVHGDACCRNFVLSFDKAETVLDDHIILSAWW